MAALLQGRVRFSSSADRDRMRELVLTHATARPPDQVPAVTHLVSLFCLGGVCVCVCVCVCARARLFVSTFFSMTLFASADSRTNCNYLRAFDCNAAVCQMDGETSVTLTTEHAECVGVVFDPSRAGAQGKTLARAVVDAAVVASGGNLAGSPVARELLGNIVVVGQVASFEVWRGSPVGSLIADCTGA